MLICPAGNGLVTENGVPDAKLKRGLTRTLYHEGVERTYHVRLPRGFNRDSPSPLVLALHGGGHTWPGGMQYLKPRLVGVVCRDINASELILDFFLRFSRLKKTR